MKTNLYFKVVLMTLVGVLASTGLFATKFSIDVRDFEFSPSNLTTVRIGDTIHFEWKNGSHTTTSTSIPAGAAAWDQPITSANPTYNYVPTVLGTYNYVCTPHASMGMTGSFTVTAAAGVPDGSPLVSVSLFPNPFSDHVTFRIQSADNHRIDRLRVFDVTGKTLREVSIPGGAYNLEQRMTFPEMAYGMLFFEFREENGAVYIRRAVKE